MSIKSLMITLVALLLVTGCTTVKPWQRGTLAKPEMSWSPDPLETTLENHIYYSKEASFGGTAAAGGGCGCN